MYYLLFLTLSVTLAGADDVSVKVGDSVTLHIKPEEIQKASDLFWFFNDEDTSIARVEKEINKISTPRNTEGRFRDRLQVDQNGSLTITKVRTTDAGLYKLEIRRSSGISLKSFNVAVSAFTEPSQWSHWVITGPVLAVLLLLVLLGVSFLIYKRHSKSNANPVI